MKLIIIGCGLAGLACAIAARKKGLEVIILERAGAISSVGAGIQIPPNATRVIKHLGLLNALLEHAIVLDYLDLRRYENGDLLIHLPGADRMVREYGGAWCVAHREDYHRVLLNAAVELGAELRLGAVVERIDCDKSEVFLEGGETISGDVIVGADGLWSKTRDEVLGHKSQLIETGDLAYRAVLSTESLTNLRSPKVDELIKQKNVTLWMGPDKHCIVYPVKQGREWNMVLLRPDDLPSDTKTAQGSLDEMRATFEGWDEVLTTLISCIPSVLKWKLLFHDELETWCKNSTVIIGDACHPTLPYQAQGAAMAIEDGAVLGSLLGSINSDFSSPGTARSKIPEILKLFERLRKQRTTLNVKGATANRRMYHLHDGEEQQRRDAELKGYDGVKACRWQWVDPEYQRELLGFDVIGDSEKRYSAWLIAQSDN